MMPTKRFVCVCTCVRMSIYINAMTTCRYVRDQTSRDDTLEEVISYGRFDPINAWRRTVYGGATAARQTISPLMALMQCFVNDSGIEGRDILDTDSTENPLFHDYNHVLIPYCSSDLFARGRDNDYQHRQIQYISGQPGRVNGRGE